MFLFLRYLSKNFLCCCCIQATRRHIPRQWVSSGWCPLFGHLNSIHTNVHDFSYIVCQFESKCKSQSHQFSLLCKCWCMPCHQCEINPFCIQSTPFFFGMYFIVLAAIDDHFTHRAFLSSRQFDSKRCCVELFKGFSMLFQHMHR